MTLLLLENYFEDGIFSTIFFSLYFRNVSLISPCTIYLFAKGASVLVGVSWVMYILMSLSPNVDMFQHVRGCDIEIKFVG